MKFNRFIKDCLCLHKTALRLLCLCLHIILSSLAFTYVHIDSLDSDALYFLWCQRYYLTECVVWSILCALFGAVFISQAIKEQNKKV